MSEAAPRGTLGTVHNAARIMTELSTGPAHQQLTDLAERSGLPLPTVHRLLRSLLVAGLVEQDPRSSRYGLGPELVRLSEQYLSRLPVLKAATPFLGELRNATKGTVTLEVLVRGDVVHVDRVDGEDAGGIFRDATRTRPAVETAGGRVLLAHLPEPAAAALRLRGDGTFPSEEQRAQWRSGDYLVHARAEVVNTAEIATPVCDGWGDAAAALSVGGSPTMFTDEALHRDVAPQLLRTAAAISRALGHG